MDDLELIALVVEMRAAQKRYFRDRTSTALQDAKRLELAVDQWLIRQGYSDGQRALFAIEEEP